VESVLGAERGVFVETVRDGSPVLSVAGMPAQQVLTFVAKDRAVVVLVGAPAGAKLQWAKGWRQVAVVKTMRGQDGGRVDVIHAATTNANLPGNAGFR
jgi:hypothetical protein